MAPHWAPVSASFIVHRPSAVAARSAIDSPRHIVCGGQFAVQTGCSAGPKWRSFPLAHWTERGQCTLGAICTPACTPVPAQLRSAKRQTARDSPRRCRCLYGAPSGLERRPVGQWPLMLPGGVSGRGKWQLLASWRTLDGVSLSGGRWRQIYWVSGGQCAAMLTRSSHHSLRAKAHSSGSEMGPPTKLKCNLIAATQAAQPLPAGPLEQSGAPGGQVGALEWVWV